MSRRYTRAIFLAWVRDLFTIDSMKLTLGWSNWRTRRRG